MIRRRIRRLDSPPAARTVAGGAKTTDAPSGDATEPSTDAEDFHVPPEEIFQEEEQDGQGTSARLRGE